MYEEIPWRPVFSVGARVRVLAATAPGSFAAPRHGLRRGHHDGLRPSHARVHGKSLGLVFAAEVGEVAAAEAAAAEAATAVEVVAAADRAASKAAADAPGAEAALSPELPKTLAAARAAWPRTPRRSPGG